MQKGEAKLLYSDSIETVSEGLRADVLELTARLEVKR
jgi:hypothetical protein